MTPDARLLFGVLEAERLLARGAVTSYAIVQAATRFTIDPYLLALAVLEKSIGVQRARAAVASMQEGDRA